jgi:hypothetical protein
MNDGNDIWRDAEIIHGYSRAQAIEDGVLVDLMQTETRGLVREAGFKFPIAMTATAFFEWINPSDKDRAEGQSINGRLWDMLTMLRHAIKGAKPGADQLLFSFIVRKDGRQHTARLKSMCVPGDDAAPVLTFMLPDED